MNTFLVTLCSRETGQDQRILVRTDDPTDMQEWIDANLDTLQPPLTISSPVVLAVRELRIKRPPLHTTMTTVEKVPAL